MCPGVNAGAKRAAQVEAVNKAVAAAVIAALASPAHIPGKRHYGIEQISFHYPIAPVRIGRIQQQQPDHDACARRTALLPPP